MFSSVSDFALSDHTAGTVKTYCIEVSSIVSN